MARVLVEIPRVGLVMETARVVRWLKAVGDTVQTGDPLVEVETEKALVEIEAGVSGRLAEIVAQPEQEVAVGAALAWIEDGGPQAAAAQSAAAPAPLKTPAPVPSPLQTSAPDGERVRASPAARKFAAEHGIDLKSVRGTGPGGRIQMEDVENISRDSQTAAPPAAEVAAHRPLSPMRRAVARAMSLSNATVPQFTVVRAVDWTEVLALQTSLAAGADAVKFNASVNDFLLQAVARALIEFPSMNAIFVGDPAGSDAGVRPMSGANIGLVVAVADGMLVPVVHGAEHLSLAELARKRADLVGRARAGRLRQEEAGGASFTVSNLGTNGPDRFTAILNPPESGILAVGRSRDVPVVRDGAVTVRPVSELTLTVDHRLADGRMASTFLSRLVTILEGREWRTA